MSQNIRDIYSRYRSVRDLTDQIATLDIYRRLLGIHIQGVEVTQAIQYYNSEAHLTDPADQLPDNSVTLIAGKPA